MRCLVLLLLKAGDSLVRFPILLIPASVLVLLRYSSIEGEHLGAGATIRRRESVDVI